MQGWFAPAGTCLLCEGVEREVGCALVVGGGFGSRSWRGLPCLGGAQGLLAQWDWSLGGNCYQNPALHGSRVFSWGILVLICIFPTFFFFLLFLMKTVYFPVND